MRPVHAAVPLVLAALVACSGTTPRPEEPFLSEEAPEWVFDPNIEWDEDDEPTVYYARGQAEILANLNLAEEKARADALADVQSFIEVTIERLTEAWINESGDAMLEGSESSLVNDEMFTREIVEGTLGGVRPLAMWWDADDYYVWVKYDAEAALSAYEASLQSRLREVNRQLTKEDREAMREELERLLAERRERE